MKIDLNGKLALVSGSTAGIGLAIAKVLAAAGASVVVNGRKQATVDQAIAAVKAVAQGGAISGVAADVSTAAGCDAVIKAVPSVDILINNTGIFEPKPFVDVPDADWTRFFETNVMSGVRLSRAYLPKMLQANWGRIVFISSESALNIPPEMVHYGFIARGLAEMTVGTGVTVNSVLPGPTMSDGVVDFIGAMAKDAGVSVESMSETFVKQHRPTSLIQRFASVEEVANMVVYAASKEASATNGAALRVEGGIIRSIA